MTLHERAAALRTRLEVVLWRHGAAGPLAAVLALLALVLAIAVLEPTRAKLAVLQAQSTREADALHRAPPAPNQPATAGDDLLALLRSAPAALERLRVMATQAQAGQIGLPRADYQSTATGALQRLQVSQTLRVTYPQLRRYVEAVLRELPSASLDQVTARREAVDQPVLEVRLRWSLWQADATATSPAGPLPTLIPRDALLSPTPTSPRDLFAVHQARPAPSAPVAPSETPPTPEAPALPFTYLGKKLEDGRWEVYASRQDQPLVLREGDVLEGQWRIDRIAPPTLTATWLPLEQARSLAIGDDR